MAERVPNSAQAGAVCDPPLQLALDRALGLASVESLEERLAQVEQSLGIAFSEKENEDARDEVAGWPAWWGTGSLAGRRWGREQREQRLGKYGLGGENGSLQ